MSKVLAILQARMGSTRLPGKMRLPIFANTGPLHFSLQETVEILQRLPELTAPNTGIGRNEGYLKSLQADVAF